MTLVRFGTYGFLSAMLAAQLSLPAHAVGATARDKMDRAKLDTKKSARSFHRDLKKTGRKLTGQDNAWDDAKDKVSDAGKNAKDEANYHVKKLKRKTR